MTSVLLKMFRSSKNSEQQALRSCGFFPKIRALDKDDEPVRISIETKGKRMINISVTGKGTLSKVQYDMNISDKKALYLKDRYGISDKTYHELALSSAEFPKLHSVKHYAHQLNASYNIQELPEGIGVFQSLKERLTTKIIRLLNQNDNQITDSVVKVKLSGDGTRIGKRIHVVNIVFSVINETNCKSVTGNHILSILQVREKYQSLKEALNPLICEVNEMQTIDINGQVIDVVFFLGGDLKFLNVITGLDACSAKYSCIWCQCSKADRWEHTKKWSMINKDNGARTVESITKCAKQKKDKYNCSNPPLFSTIPLTHVVPDTLHLFLRIADQLVGHLIAILREYDNEVKSSRKGTCKQAPNMDKFETFVHSLNIEWCFIVDGAGKLTYRDFTGPEHWRILNSIDLGLFLAETPFNKLSKLKDLWSNFKLLIKEISSLSNQNEVTLNAFEDNARCWLRLFCEIYPTKDVTPYMHILTNHIGESVRLNGNISVFSQQGLEKLNDYVTGWYFRGTNHKAVAFKQIMEKQNRIEDLELECERSMIFSVTCSSCGIQGHNKRTCSAR